VDQPVGVRAVAVAVGAVVGVVDCDLGPAVPSISEAARWTLHGHLTAISMVREFLSVDLANPELNRPDTDEDSGKTKSSPAAGPAGYARVGVMNPKAPCLQSDE